MFPESQNADVSSEGQTGQSPSPEFTEICVIGRRKSVVEILVSLLFGGVLVTAFLTGMAGPVLFVFVPVFLISFWINLTLCIRPPRVIVKGNDFTLQAIAKWHTSATNVSQLELRSGQLFVTFLDVQSVLPKEQRPVLTSQFSKHGYHVKIGDGVFSLEDVNAMRAALGMTLQEQDRHAEFEARLNGLTPRVIVTPLLIAACVIVFLIMALTGEGIVKANTLALIQWGANYGPLTNDGQWWRLLTSIFLHLGVVHLLFNMWILKDIGRVVERLVGNTGFAIGFAFSGFSGSVASVLWHDSIVSSGASGAVFGVFGMSLGFLLLNRSAIPDEIIKTHRGNAVAFLSYNVLVGLTIPWVDQAAHLGGFLAGFCCGLVLSCDLTVAKFQRRFRNSVLTVGGILFGLAAIFSLPSPKLDLLSIGRRIDEVDAAAAAISQETGSLLQSGKQEAAASAERIRQEVIPKYQKLATVLKEIPDRNEAQSRTKALFLEYVRLRQLGWDLMAKSIEANDMANMGFAIETFDEANKVLAKALPNLKDRPIPSNLQTEVALFAASESRVFTRYDELLQQSSAGKITDQELATLIERDVLPAWQNEETRFSSRTASLPVENQPVVKDLKNYLALQREGWQLQIHALRERSHPDRRGVRSKTRRAGQEVRKL